MQKVLIAINNMKIGGAQKSLLSFLQCLSDTEHMKEYEVDLLVMSPEGAYMAEIPESIHLIPPHSAVRWLSAYASPELILKHFTWRAVLGKASWIIRSRLGIFDKGLNKEQKLWQNWRRFIPQLDRQYDFAVSYMDGPPNYWLMEKVKSKKKILWVHNEYQKQKYSPAYDRRFFEKCDAVITISDKCRSCIVQEFPDIADKIHVLENITSSQSVMRKGSEAAELEFGNGPEMKILSVGRLNRQKGFDIAVDAAKLMKQAGARFLWLVAGDGAEKEALQRQIEQNGVQDCFRLLGARENPYPYMKACDILVQPSRFEGKSIVLDEAKIFDKPIVATNYLTVNDSIEHGKSGWIVDMTPEALCQGILYLMNNEELRRQMAEYLERQPKGNDREIKKYIELIMK